MVPTGHIRRPHSGEMVGFAPDGAHEEGHIVDKWYNLVPTGHTRRGASWRNGKIWSQRGMRGEIVKFGPPGPHQEGHIVEKW